MWRNWYFYQEHATKDYNYHNLYDMIHKDIVIVKGDKDYNIKSDYEDRLDTMIDNVMKGIYIETKKNMILGLSIEKLL